MSEIGSVYARYREALDWSLENFDQERQSSYEAMKEFYPAFFNKLIRDSSWIRSRQGKRWHQALHLLKEQFGQGEDFLTFAAIDGTCDKKQLSEMMVFYGGSYAQGGTLSVNEQLGQLKYARWSPSEDTSVVAYLPIPLNKLNLFEDEDWLFRADDEDRSTANNIHTSLMQFAEIYLAYRRITSEDRPPKILLLDHSLSSILLSTDVMHLIHPFQPNRQTLGWVGAWVDRWGRAFEPADGLVAHSHPMNHSLEVPSIRSNSIATAIVALLTNYWQIGNPGEREKGQPIKLSDFLDHFPLTNEQKREAVIKNIRNLGTDRDKGLGAFKVEGEYIHPIDQLENGRFRTLRQRWYDLRQLFEYIGEQLFRERRVEVLQLHYQGDSGRRGPRWMNDNDIKFLIGLGLRLIIELCWQKRILLLGIAKDSSSRFLTRNYLSVLSAANILNIPKTAEPPGSDRLVCEMIPLIDQEISAPWSTVEFDAVFMTLRALADREGNPEIQGVKGDVIVPSDGLFLRSLINLFLERRPDKTNPLMGHVLFLDRIAYPYFDSQNRSPSPITSRNSKITPLFFPDRDTDNFGQDIAMMVSDLLTRNCFPEAIGQPDALHRADLGAKALGKRINQLIEGSIQKLKINPLNIPFRDYRDNK